MSVPSFLMALQYEVAFPFFSSEPGVGSEESWSKLDAAQRLERAAAEQPDRVEPWLEIGDYWMRAGNFIRAANAFTRALEIRPDCPDILLSRAAATALIASSDSEKDVAAAIALGAAPPEAPARLDIPVPNPDETVATIYVDMNDIVEYLSVNNTFSGIQRVVGNVFREIARKSTPHARDVIPVLPDYGAGIILAADPELFFELIDIVETGNPTRDHLNRLLLKIDNSLTKVEPQAGDIMLLAGAFWILPSYDYFMRLRDRGVAVTVFVHDLIQVNNPGFVEPKATNVFRRSLVDIAELASFFTTNSLFVASELRRFLRDQMGLETPVHAVPLATEMSLIVPEPWEDEALRTEFGENGYVLCVCTLEVRKNHIYLLRLWEELIRRKQPNLPTLVLVGKWGWQIDAFREEIEACNFLDGRIKIMPAVSETVLSSLYRNCLFTIYPSFAEGWGLPIGESLAFGKPCIASGTTSMPEVGRGLVHYIDPLNLESSLTAVQALINDRAMLERWTREVEKGFQQRPWAEFADHLLGATRALARSTSAPKAYARLLPGQMAVLGHSRVEGAALAGRPLRTARMIRDKGWLHNEALGAWAISPVATLRFIAEDCEPLETVQVVLALQTASGESAMACQLATDQGATDYKTIRAEPALYHCSATIGPDRVVRVSVSFRGKPEKMDGPPLYACLSRVGFYRTDRPDEVLKLMEDARFEDWRVDPP